MASNKPTRANSFAALSEQSARRNKREKDRQSAGLPVKGNPYGAKKQGHGKGNWGKEFEGTHPEADTAVDNPDADDQNPDAEQEAEVQIPTMTLSDFLGGNKSSTTEGKSNKRGGRKRVKRNKKGQRILDFNRNFGSAPTRGGRG